MYAPPSRSATVGGAVAIDAFSPAEYWLSRNRHAINQQQSQSRCEGYGSSSGRGCRLTLMDFDYMRLKGHRMKCLTSSVGKHMSVASARAG